MKKEPESNSSEESDIEETPSVLWSVSGEPIAQVMARSYSKNRQIVLDAVKKVVSTRETDRPDLFNAYFPDRVGKTLTRVQNYEFVMIDHEDNRLPADIDNFLQMDDIQCFLHDGKNSFVYKTDPKLNDFDTCCKMLVTSYDSPSLERYGVNEVMDLCLHVLGSAANNPFSVDDGTPYVVQLQFSQ